MLSCSGLSEEEKAQHPEFVLKVLDFQQKQIHKEVELEDSDFSDSDDDSEDEPPPNIPSRPPPPSAAKQGSSAQLKMPAGAPPNKGPPPSSKPPPNASGPSSSAASPAPSPAATGEVTLRDLLSHQDPRKIYADFQEIGKGYLNVFIFFVCVWIFFDVFSFHFFCSVSGTVQLARDTRTGMNVAIKQMVIAKQAKKEVLTNEILIMKESHHDNIVNFLDAYMVDGEIWV